jgi:hypothetical protein
MTELQQERRRTQSGGESADASQETTEATDEELSDAIAGIELETDGGSGAGLPSSAEDLGDPHLCFEADETDPSYGLADESGRTLDLESAEPDRPLDRLDDGAGRTVVQDGASNGGACQETTSDGPTDSRYAGLRALLSRIF